MSPPSAPLRGVGHAWRRPLTRCTARLCRDAARSLTGGQPRSSPAGEEGASAAARLPPALPTSLSKDCPRRAPGGPQTALKALEVSHGARPPGATPRQGRPLPQPSEVSSGQHGPPSGPWPPAPPHGLALPQAAAPRPCPGPLGAGCRAKGRQGCTALSPPLSPPRRPNTHQCPHSSLGRTTSHCPPGVCTSRSGLPLGLASGSLARQAGDPACADGQLSREAGALCPGPGPMGRGCRGSRTFSAPEVGSPLCPRHPGLPDPALPRDEAPGAPGRPCVRDSAHSGAGTCLVPPCWVGPRCRDGAALPRPLVSPRGRDGRPPSGLVTGGAPAATAPAPPRRGRPARSGRACSGPCWHPGPGSLGAHGAGLSPGLSSASRL